MTNNMPDRIWEYVAGIPATEYVRADIHDALTAENAALTARVAELKAVLAHYQETFCEGLCTELALVSEYTPAMDPDCSGCKARAILAKKVTP